MALVKRILVGSLAFGALAAAPALAHEGHSHGGFLEGLLHPLTGLDHLVVMLAVGALAVRQGGAWLLALPLAFVAAMAGGALLGLNEITLPFSEAIIVVSIVAVTAGLVFSDRLPGFVALVGCTVFALAHGYAHAIAEPVVPMLYASATPSVEGFTAFLNGALIATALLHLCGAFVALYASSLVGRLVATRD